MSKTFDAIHDGQDTIKNETFQLERLAESFADTGNFHVSDRLLEIARIINESANTMAKAYDDYNAELWQAQQDQFSATINSINKAHS